MKRIRIWGKGFYDFTQNIWRKKEFLYIQTYLYTYRHICVYNIFVCIHKHNKSKQRRAEFMVYIMERKIPKTNLAYENKNATVTLSNVDSFGISSINTLLPYCA